MSIKEYALKLYKRFCELNMSIYAGQAAFFLMMSFFPFLLFFFSVLKLTKIPEETFIKFMAFFFPMSFDDYLAGYANEMYMGSGTTLSITIILAIFICAKGFVALVQGMNAMYNVKETRNFVFLRLVSMVYSIVFAIILLLVLAIVVFWHDINESIISGLPFLFAHKELISQFRMILSIPILFIFFLIMYKVLPNTKLMWRNQIKGAIFSSVAWFIFSVCFSVYVDYFTKYSSFYGTMATIALLMLWLYWCMYVLFFGGIINYFSDVHYREKLEAKKLAKESEAEMQKQAGETY